MCKMVQCRDLLFILKALLARYILSKRERFREKITLINVFFVWFSGNVRYSAPNVVRVYLSSKEFKGLVNLCLTA